MNDTPSLPSTEQAFQQDIEPRMKRCSIRFEHADASALRHLARERNTSVAALIRAAIKKALPRASEQ